MHSDMKEGEAAMGRYIRAPQVRVGPHAIARYKQRVGPTTGRKLSALVSRRLGPALATGMVTDHNGAVHLPIGETVVSILIPSMYGGWDMVTVYTAVTQGQEVVMI